MNTAQMLTLTTELRAETTAAWGLFDGQRVDVRDYASNTVVQRDHLHWVPKSRCKITKRTRDHLGRTIVDIAMPEWIAAKAGLNSDRCRKTVEMFR